MVNATVTGGAGFIGYHLTKLLLEKNYEVTVLDNFSDYYSKKLKKLNALELEQLGANIVNGSILVEKDVEKTIDDSCDVIFHFAAQPGVRYSTMNPIRSLRINVEGTAQILKRSHEKQIKKVVIASSSSVFGPNKYLPIDEIHPKNPISFYGVSKLATENLVKAYTYLYKNIDISIIRPFTVIGPRQRPDMALNIFITNALNEKEITIFGDGNQTRDWTHVENIVNGAYLMSIKKEAKNEDFNIGSGIRTPVCQVLDHISEYTGKELKLIYKDFDKADAKDTLADIDKAKKLLGYEPKKSLQSAIEEFTNDYQKIKSEI